MRKGKDLKRLKLIDIQRIIYWAFNRTKRPSFLPLREKDRPLSINLIHINESSSDVQRKIKKMYHIKWILELNEAIPFDLLSDCITREIENNTISVSYDYINIENLRFIPRISFEKLYCSDIFFNTSDEPTNIDFTGYSKAVGLSSYDIIAIDVEKVITKDGSELGRATLVDSNGKVIYDKIIKPDDPIINYNTKYSGLTKDIIAGGIRKDDVRQEVLQFIGENTILIGHGIENDLNALNLYHNNIIDTAYVFLNYQSRKLSLAQLVKTHLKREIQKKTHDSSEDAIASLELLSIKIQQILRFMDKDRGKLKINAEVINKAPEDLKKEEENKLRVVKCNLNALISIKWFKKRSNTLSMFLYEKDGKVFLAF